MFAFSHFGQNASFLRSPFETAQSAIQRFGFANSDLTHLYPSLHDLFREV